MLSDRILTGLNWAIKPAFGPRANVCRTRTPIEAFRFLSLTETKSGPVVQIHLSCWHMWGGIHWLAWINGADEVIEW